MTDAHFELAQPTSFECDDREANADASEYWAKDYSDVDPSDMWASRNEAIEQIKSSWESASEAAQCGDWEELETAMDALGELDA